MSLFLAQNVMNRITNGLIGMDVFSRERRNNDYLKGFLSLDETEIRSALVFASRTALVPMQEEPTTKIDQIVQVIRQDQEALREIETLSQQDIENIMADMKGAIDFIYNYMKER